jgi:hypothetical protein
VIGAGSGSWLPDSLPVVGSLPAVTVGAVLLIVVAAMVATGHLVRDGPLPILLGFTILAAAFFVLPTRVHERYLFPFFATGALLAAPGALRAAGLAMVAVLNTLNLHAVLAGNLLIGPAGGGGGGRGLGGTVRPGLDGAGAPGGPGGFGFAGIGSINLPWGDLARSEVVVAASAVVLGVALAALLAGWLLVLLRPQAISVSRPSPAPSAP